MLIKTTYLLTIKIIISGTGNCRSIIEATSFNLASLHLRDSSRTCETSCREEARFTESWKSYDNFFFHLLPPLSLTSRELRVYDRNAAMRVTAIQV